MLSRVWAGGRRRRGGIEQHGQHGHQGDENGAVGRRRGAQAGQRQQAEAREAGRTEQQQLQRAAVRSKRGTPSSRHRIASITGAVTP